MHVLLDGFPGVVLCDRPPIMSVVILFGIRTLRGHTSRKE